MTRGDSIYAYNIELYSRNFLNCAQRHSVVMLRERGVAVDYLFHNSLVSSDEVLEQIVRNLTPKYDFASACLSDDDFRRVGVARECFRVDHYADAQSDILACVERDGFALLAGDVFYFQHCPEYRNRHLFHLVALRGFDDQQSQWTLVDDNPASVLSWYQYPQAQVADFYNNNSVREYRSYRQQPMELAEIRGNSRLAGQRYLAGYNDSGVLLTQLRDIINAPWQSTTLQYGRLHDAFAVMTGSRRCYAAFLALMQPDHASVSLASSCAQLAGRLRNSFVQARLTGRCSVDKICARASELYALESQLVKSAQQLIR